MTAASSDPGEPRSEQLESSQLIDAVRVREQFLEDILGSLESFVTIDRDWRCTFANAAAEKLAGVGPDGLLGKSLSELATADAREQFEGPLRKAMADRVSVEFEVISPADGQVYHAKAYPLSDGGLAVYVRDVTAWARAREARLQAEQDYRELVESVNSAILRWTSDGLISYFNEHAERLFGWRAEEVVGRHVSLLLPEPDNGGSDLSHLIDDILAEPELYATNMNENVRKDGTRLWMAWTHRALLDEDGSVREVLAVGNDVTERRRTEEALRESEAEKVAQRERNRLARELHDSVTQALFAATIKAEALALNGELPVRSAEAVEEVRRLTRGALAQMRTLLLELRADPLEDIPVRQLLRHLVESTESRVGTAVRLTIRGDTAAPAALNGTLYRIVQEALNNVARHAGAANAWVVLDTDASSVHLVVGDDGRGYDPSVVDPSHLGLRSMRERAAEVGGELRFVSAPDEGTLVILDWYDDQLPAQPG